jgi:hypothetical protein
LLARFEPRDWKKKNMNMKMIKNLVLMMGVTGLSLVAYGQTPAGQAAPPPPRVTPADAKNHVGDTVTVCGKVVGTKVAKYGLAGRGKPVSFDLDQPEPNPVFFFVTFGEQPGGPEEAIAAYQGKSVCATGKIALAGGVPYIMAGDRATQVKPETAK